MRRVTAIISSACVLALTATSALAAEPQRAAAQAPLAPGHAAGVHDAEMMQPSTAVWIAGAAIVVGGIVLVTSGGSSSHAPATTTTGPTR